MISKYCFVIVILCGLLQLSHCFKCEFKNIVYSGTGRLYSCIVRDLVNKNNDTIVSKFTGTDASVNRGLEIRGLTVEYTDTRYIPRGLSSLFNLSALVMTNTQLVTVRADNFDGMEDLEFLDLSFNKLTTLRPTVFVKLLKLKYVSVHNNQLSEITADLFAKNIHMERLYFNKNRIEFFGATVFDELKKLSFVSVTANICFKDNYHETSVEKVKKGILANCINPIGLSERIMNSRDEIDELNKRLRQLDDENMEKINKLKENFERQRKKDSFTAEEKCEEKIVDNRITGRANLFITKKSLAKCEKNLETFKEDCKNFKKTNSVNLNCIFNITTYGYLCKAQDFVVNLRDMTLDQVIGTHLDSKVDDDVSKLIIDKAFMLFLANGIFKTFSKLEYLIILDSNVQKLIMGDFNLAGQLKFLQVEGNQIRSLGINVFKGAETLENLMMNSNQITDISVDTFQGLSQLKKLSLKDNLLRQLDLGTFKELSSLETLVLSSNKFKSIDGKILQFNINLETFLIDHNELREITEDILNHSEKLKFVNFNYNFCIAEEFHGDQFHDLLFNIKHCCKNPKDSTKLYNCGNDGWENSIL